MSQVRPGDWLDLARVEPGLTVFTLQKLTRVETWLVCAV